MKKLLFTLAIFLTPLFAHADYSYLAQWEWVSDEQGDRWQAPYGDNVGAIDMRSVAQMSKKGGFGGWGLFTYTEPKDINGAVAMTDKEALNYAWASLTVYADPDGITAPKPLMPDEKLEMKIQIGDEVRVEKFENQTSLMKGKILAVIQNDYLAIESKETRRKVLGANMIKFRTDDHTIFLPKFALDEGWEMPTTIIGDNFTDTNGLILSSHTASGPYGGWSWTNVSGNFYIGFGGTSATSSDATVLARAEIDLSSSDMYAQVYDSGNGANRYRNIRVRWSSSINTMYSYVHNGSGTSALQKVIAGVNTTISSVSSSGGGTIYISAVGSTIEARKNGVSLVIVTDTSVTGNLRAGIGGSGGARADRYLDDFLAEDIIASSTASVRGGYIIFFD